MEFKAYLDKFEPYFYLVFRVLVGLLFLQHGVQKLFGWFSTGTGVELFSLMGLVGVIEAVGGIAVVLGLFTRSAALMSSILMLIVYFKVHFPGGFIPILNKGELALVYLAAFLVLATIGPGIWSVEKLLLGEDKF